MHFTGPFELCLLEAPDPQGLGDVLKMQCEHRMSGEIVGDPRDADVEAALAVGDEREPRVAPAE
ncbi:hypothetical protein A5752_05580 [Mycobacterium sp. 852002-51961_SCH5331710]|nr:hypothetical protein A5752_05580 [Mycobacterium sp. 852002-51961_SCH5331710]